MQINSNPILTTLMSNYDLLNIREGHRYLIEIVNVGQNNEGVIIINGTRINVKFETNVQIGEKFWVTGSIEDNKIVLKRELGEISKPEIDTKQNLLLNRGSSANADIAKYITDFTNKSTIINSLLNSRNSQLGSLISFLWSIIPKWSEVKKSKENFLYNYYKRLGVELEKTVYEYLFQSKSQNGFTSDSVKFQLLYLLAQKQNTLGQNEKDMLVKLLHEITGQQLWIQPGNKENIYMLLHFPLQDNGILYNCKIAIEGKRKGRKISVDFFHIALQVETENLGVVGVDLLIYRDSINVKLLNDKLIDGFKTNIDELQSQIDDIFTNLGYNLKNFSIDSFSNYSQFEKFISGNSMLGVDLKL